MRRFTNYRSSRNLQEYAAILVCITDIMKTYVLVMWDEYAWITSKNHSRSLVLQ
jgi:hypothetical protein